MEVLQRRSDQPSTVASLLAYEEAENPDGDVIYGFVDLDEACEQTAPADFEAEPYGGVIESNPYAIARRGRDVLVADAAGNSVLRVSSRGRISLIAVLPPVPQVIRAEIASSYGLAPCVVGATYMSEPVPADVEHGPDGQLYVATLPGFPLPSFQGVGAVWKIDLRTGRHQQLASGFLSAVDIAVSQRGAVYVADLYAGRISEIRDGNQHVIAEVTLPGALEMGRARSGHRRLERPSHPLARGQRRSFRLAPPAVGAAHPQQARALALGVSGRQGAADRVLIGPAPLHQRRRRARWVPCRLRRRCLRSMRRSGRVLAADAWLFCCMGWGGCGVARGTVLRFDGMRGYGFVTPEGGGEDVFVHVNDLLDDKYDLMPGATVEFEVARGDRGLKGYDVRIVQEAPDGGSSGDGSRSVAPSRTGGAQLDDGECDIVAPSVLRTELTEAWLREVPDLTAAQIVALRDAVARIASSHGWIDT